MRHYQCLSAAHAIRKYVNRRFEEDEVTRLGWHGWRPHLRAEDIQLPPATELRTTATDADLDASEPWIKHWFERCVAR
jgi:hypothetical protein